MNKNKIKSFIIMCLISIIMIMPNYTYSAEKAILGDINRDGKVDSMDLLYIMRHIIAESSEEHKEWMLEGEKLQLADMTENGKVDSSDMLVILRYIAANNNQEKIGKEHPEWLEQKEIELKSFNEIKEESEVININKDDKKKEEEEKTNNAKTIKLNKSIIEIEKGKTEQVIARVEPQELGNEKITWRIMNSRIAEVDEEGKVTAKENGETILIARTEEGKEAVCEVIVGTKAKKIVVDKEEVRIDLSERKAEKIEAKVEPEDAINKEITVESSNGNIAGIDGEGRIIAKSNGETEITLRTTNGIEKKIKVVVTTSETGIKLDKNYVQLDLSQNKQTTIKATIEPSTASNKEITYMSSNEEIVTIDKEGRVTAKGSGEAKIIARTTNGKEAECKVEVQAEEVKINMNKEVEIDLSEEKEKELKIEVESEEAKNKAIMVRSSNEEVATVDGKGIISGKKNGTAEIIVGIAGTDIVETCEVTVKTSATGIKLSEKEVELELTGNKTKKIKAELEPSTVSEKEIEWENSNKEVVEIKETEEGIEIEGKKDGEAIITARIAGKEIKATCKVTVKTEPVATEISLTQVSNSESKITTEIQSTKNGQISAEIKPAGAEITDIEWINSNPEKLAIERVIENGTYYIKSGIDNKKVLDVAGGSTANKAQIQIYARNETDAQKFEITNVGGEYYTIKSKKSGKLIHVKNGGTEAGTKVQQYASNGTDSQKWEFEYLGDGYYQIRSKINGLYLDVKDAKTDNKTPIQVWTENKTKAQKFKLEQIEKKTPIVENGTYIIKSSIDENKVLDVASDSKENKAAIQLYENNKTDEQKFEIIGLGNGYYVIRGQSSGKVLDIPNGATEKSTKIQQYSYNGTNAQIWKIEKEGEYYRFKSKISGLYLDVTDAKAENKTSLQIWTENKTKAQRFKLEQISKEIKHTNIEQIVLKTKKSGTVTITAKLANGKTAITKVKTQDIKITGGQAVSESAVYLACRADPEKRLYVEYPYTVLKRDSRAKAYIDARRKLVKGNNYDGGDYASCDMGVAVAVRYSGVDKNMEYKTIPNIWPYLRNSKNWKNVGTLNWNNYSNMQPGDVLINSHHILIYVGNSTIKRKYKNSGADIYEAGYSSDKYGSYYPSLTKLSNRRGDNTYTIFRHVNANKKMYDKILK